MNLNSVNFAYAAVFEVNNLIISIVFLIILNIYFLILFTRKNNLNYTTETLFKSSTQITVIKLNSAFYECISSSFSIYFISTTHSGSLPNDPAIPNPMKLFFTSAPNRSNNKNVHYSVSQSLSQSVIHSNCNKI